jgi:cytochrome c biogenesis protein
MTTVAGQRSGAASVPPVPPGDGPGGPGLGVTGWLRWAWRRLTSMRTAVILLALLALAAIPGSVLPQRNVASDPGAVVRFYRDNPDLAPWLDRLGMFDVYASAWFAAIYLLLLISMVGCVLPRCRVLWRSVRSAPPEPPRTLTRFERRGSIELAPASGTEPGAAQLEALAHELERRGFRLRRGPDWLSGERGYLREVGNLGFHLSLLVLLVGIAGGRLFGYEARVAVVEGESFTNVASQYDAFTPSVWTDVDGLESFSFELDSFDASFETSGPRRGEPRSFEAVLSVRTADDVEPEEVTVRPNHPLEVDGTKAFLTGHGYAPVVTVRDGTGAEVFSGPVIFLPADQNFTSDGVIKAPDAQPTQLGFEGLFLPTAASGSSGPFSAFPGVVNPRLVLTAWTGDLGFGDGVPQSVFTLDKDQLDPVLRPGAERPLREVLALGQTLELPGGQGSITFEDVRRFGNFQVARDPGKEVSLLAALMLLAGLTTSLVVRRRRVYARVLPTASGAGRLDVASQPLTRRGEPEGELDDLLSHLTGGARP